MEQIKFKQTEEKYRELREKLDHGEITPEDMKAELKKMMVLDEAGNYWMIGGKTGKWYVYNGTDWKEGDPFEQEEPAAAVFTEEYAAADEDTSAQNGEAIIAEEPFVDAHRFSEADPFPQTGEEQEQKQEQQQEEEEETAGLAAAVETLQAPAPGEMAIPAIDTVERDKTDRHTICRVCKSKISLYSIYCPVCGANQKEVATSTKKARARGRENELLITSVKITSLIFFLGGLGLIAGVLLGAAFGIFNSLFAVFQPYLPEMLADTRGGLAGGLIFAAVGGIAGFIASALAAAVLSAVYNGIAYIFGGIRFKVRQ